jgi:hypothetical protein
VKNVIICQDRLGTNQKETEGKELCFLLQCFARSAAQPKDMPCQYGLPSIYRSDVSFWDQVRETVLLTVFPFSF